MRFGVLMIFIHSLDCSTTCECIKIIPLHSIIGEHLGDLHMEILQMALPRLFLYVSFGDRLYTVLQGTNLRLRNARPQDTGLGGPLQHAPGWVGEHTGYLSAGSHL